MAIRGTNDSPSPGGERVRRRKLANPGASAPISPVDVPTILAIADALPVMVGYCDADQVYRYCNQPLADWYELPRRRIIGRTLEAIMGPAAYATRRARIDAALAGEHQKATAPFDHPTRGALTTMGEYVPHRDADGRVIGLMFVVQDVTEQKNAYEAVRESETRFRRIADSAPLPMWVTRLDRSRDFVNQAYVDLMGGTEEEARHLDWMARIHPDDRGRVIEETRAGEASGASFSMEARFLAGSGEYRWMKAVSQPRHDAQGQLIGSIGVSTDITLIKQAELELRRLVDERTAELQESEQRFRAIFDMVLEIIVLMKPDGTIIDVNQTQANWRATDPRRSIGGKLWDAPTIAMHPQHILFAKEAVSRAARGETVQRELLMERPGQPSATLDASIQPVRNAAGDIQYLIFEARDVTELKSAQDQLRQSQKMEALGQLTGGIAHDFNNLLTVVVGGLDLITKRVEDERLLRYATNALAAAERGARLTAQLLAFSRVQRLEVRPTSIAPLIEEMKPLLRNVLGPGIDKRYQIAEDLPPVLGDPTQVEVAVLNLAINARDAMPDGGTLTVSAQRCRIDDATDVEPGDYVELVIADTGFGMAPDVVARAIEPFFTTKDVGKGTGLGLSMVYGMARQSGGTVTIASEVGTGTSVSLLFRCAEAAESEVAVRPKSSERRASARVAHLLVIDDDDDVRAFIVGSLEEHGHRVTATADGAEGLASFAAERPDLVVLDFLMPGLSGAEVAEQMLGQYPDQPILFVSGYQETDAISRLAPGATLLAKPFRPAALDDEVRKLLDRRQ